MKKIILYIAIIISYQLANADNKTIIHLDNKPFDDNKQSQQFSKQLWQNINRQSQRKEQQIIAESEPAAPKTQQKVTSVTQSNNADIVTQLMQAINSYRWNVVEQILAEYQQYKGHNQALVLFAQASLAKSRGNIKQAEKLYNKVLALYPNFIRAKLDLAKLHFENKANLSAKKIFTGIDTTQLPPAVDSNIKAYLQATEMRNEWYGNLSVDLTKAYNKNESSKRKDCLLETPDKQCVVVREAPKPINTRAINYELAIGKRFELADNNGIVVRGLAYGEYYKDTPEFNENTLSLDVGYNFQNAKNSITISPTFEYSSYDNQSLYNSKGIKAEWNRVITPQLNSNLSVSYKDINYTDKSYEHNNSEVVNASGSATYALTPNTLLFAGIDWTKSNTKEAVNSYHKKGIRAGIQHHFDNGLNMSLASSLNNRQYDEYNAVFGETREDTRQNHSLTLSHDKLSVYGFTPQLSVNHTINKSNVDWVYSYDKTNVYLKINKRF